jgi:hypothetical protein
MRNDFPHGGPWISMDQWHLRYHFETCTFRRVEFRANSSSEIAPNLVPILWISQRCPNLVYSQLITSSQNPEF